MNIINIEKNKLLLFLLKKLEINYYAGWYTEEEYKNMIVFISMFLEILEESNLINVVDLLMKIDLRNIIIKKIKEKKSKNLIKFFREVLKINLDNDFEIELTKGMSSVVYGTYVVKYDSFLNTLQIENSKLFNDYQKLIYKHYQVNFNLNLIKKFAKENEIDYLNPSKNEANFIILNV